MVNKEINIAMWDKKLSYLKNEIVRKYTGLYMAKENIPEDTDWDDSKWEVLSFSKNNYFQVDCISFAGVLDDDDSINSCLVEVYGKFKYFTRISVNEGYREVENIHIENSVFYTNNKIITSDGSRILNDIYMVFVNGNLTLENKIDFSDFKYTNMLDLGNSHEFIINNKFYMDQVDVNKNINGIVNYKSENVSYYEGEMLLADSCRSHVHYDYIVKSIADAPIIQEEGLTLLDLSTKKTYTSKYVEDHIVTYSELYAHFENYNINNVYNRKLKKARINKMIPIPKLPLNVTVHESWNVFPGLMLSTSPVLVDCDNLEGWTETFWFAKEFHVPPLAQFQHPRYIGAWGTEEIVHEDMGRYPENSIGLVWDNEEIDFGEDRWLVCFKTVDTDFIDWYDGQIEWNTYFMNAFSFEMTGTYFIEDERQRSIPCNILLFGDENNVLATYDTNNKFHIVKDSWYDPIFITDTYTFTGQVPLDTGDTVEYDVIGPMFNFSEATDFVITGTITCDDGQQVFIHETTPYIFIGEFHLYIYFFDDGIYPKIVYNHFIPDISELTERNMPIVLELTPNSDYMTPIIMSGYFNHQFTMKPTTYLGLEVNKPFYNIQVWNSFYRLPQSELLNMGVTDKYTDEHGVEQTKTYSNPNSVKIKDFIIEDLSLGETHHINPKINADLKNEYVLTAHDDYQFNTKLLFYKHGILQLNYQFWHALSNFTPHTEDAQEDHELIIYGIIQHTNNKREENFYKSITIIGSEDDNRPILNDNVYPTESGKYKTQINVLHWDLSSYKPRVAWNVQYKNGKTWIDVPYDHPCYIKIWDEGNLIVNQNVAKNGDIYEFREHVDFSDSKKTIEVGSESFTESKQTFAACNYKKNFKFRPKKRWLIVAPGNHSLSAEELNNPSKEKKIHAYVMDRSTTYPTADNDVTVLIRYKKPFDKKAKWSSDIPCSVENGRIKNGIIDWPFSFRQEDLTKTWSYIFELEIKETDMYYRTITSTNLIYCAPTQKLDNNEWIKQPASALVHFGSDAPVKYISNALPQMSFLPYIDPGIENGPYGNFADVKQIYMPVAFRDTNDEPVQNYLQALFDEDHPDNPEPTGYYLACNRMLSCVPEGMLSVDLVLCNDEANKTKADPIKRNDAGASLSGSIAATYTITQISPSTNERYVISNIYDESTTALHTSFPTLSGDFNFVFVEFSGNRYWLPTTIVVPVYQNSDIMSIMEIDPYIFSGTIDEINNTVFTVKLKRFDRTPIISTKINIGVSYAKKKKEWDTYQFDLNTDNNGEATFTKILDKFKDLNKLKKDTDIAIKATYEGKYKDEHGAYYDLANTISPSYRMSNGVIVLQDEERDLIRTRLSGYPSAMQFSPSELCQQEDKFAFYLKLEYFDDGTQQWLELDKNHEFSEIYLSLSSGVSKNNDAIKNPGKVFKRKFEGGYYHWELDGWQARLLRNNLDTGELIFRVNDQDGYEGCSANIMLFGCKNHFKANHSCRLYNKDALVMALAIIGTAASCAAAIKGGFGGQTQTREEMGVGDFIPGTNPTTRAGETIRTSPYLMVQYGLISEQDVRDLQLGNRAFSILNDEEIARFFYDAAQRNPYNMPTAIPEYIRTAKGIGKTEGDFIAEVVAQRQYRSAIPRNIPWRQRQLGPTINVSVGNEANKFPAPANGPAEQRISAVVTGQAPDSPTEAQVATLPEQRQAVEEGIAARGINTGGENPLPMQQPEGSGVTEQGAPTPGGAIVPEPNPEIGLPNSTNTCVVIVDTLHPDELPIFVGVLPVSDDADFRRYRNYMEDTQIRLRSEIRRMGLQGVVEPMFIEGTDTPRFRDQMRQSLRLDFAEYSRARRFAPGSLYTEFNTQLNESIISYIRWLQSERRPYTATYTGQVFTSQAWGRRK